MGILIGILLIQFPKISLDTSTEGLLHPDDPALVAYNEFRDNFGRDEMIIIAFRPANVFDLEFLNTLKAIHYELEENVPYLNDINSLINARNTRGEEDELIVENLLEEWPDSKAALEKARRLALANQMYRNILLSEDGTFTTIIIRTNPVASDPMAEKDLMKGFDNQSNALDAGLPSNSPASYLGDAENSEVVDAVNSIVNKYKDLGLNIYLTGTPVVNQAMKLAMIRNMRKFMIILIAMISAALFIMFNRISGIVLPLLIILLTFLSTLSIMATMGVSLKIPSQVLPSFILAISASTSVHVLAIFYHCLEEGKPKEIAISHAAGHSGLAILMANVTTAAGLISFASADVAPVADLGIYAGVGVLLSFVYTLVLLPALISLIPFKTEKNSRMAYNQRLMDRFLQTISTISTTYPRRIVAISAVIVFLSAIGALQVRFSLYPLKWFKADNIIRKDTETIDRAMHGSVSVEVVLDTMKDSGWQDPDRLKRLDEADTAMEALSYEDIYVGKAYSLTTILKEINRVLNNNVNENYTIPQDRELVAQEFLLFENSGSDDLNDFVDHTFSKARLTLKFPFKDAVHYEPFREMMEKYFQLHFPDCRVKFTGMISLLARTIGNTVTSMAKSYVIAMAIITLLMILLIGRIRIGLLSMIPNLAPILLMLGIIGTFHFPMDMFTMTVASLAIGLAVDDTIHFMHNFKRYYDATGDPEKAVFETLQTTGRAMLVTTTVLSLGFFTFMCASLNNIIRFGFLTGVTLISALIADYFLAPALMVIVSKKKLCGKKQ